MQPHDSLHLLQFGNAVTLLAVAATAALARHPLPQDRHDAWDPSTHSVQLELLRAPFVANCGQWSNPDFGFVCNTSGLDVAFEPSAVSMWPHCNLPGGFDTFDSEIARMAVRVTFPQSNCVVPEGQERLHTTFNYFVGGECRRSLTYVPTYAALIYPSLYSGIDLLVMKGRADGFLKYEFHAGPGADLTQIRMTFEGHDSLTIDPDGNLVIAAGCGLWVDRHPIAWQDIGAERRIIPAEFRLVDDRTCALVLTETPDPGHSVVIDPEIDWMTYLGGPSADHGLAIAVGADGATYIAGHTVSDQFEGRINERIGAHDAFLARIDGEGNLDWMTFVGGTNDDEAMGVGIDGAGAAIIGGSTQSVDFGGRTNDYRGGVQDGFVARVLPTGELDWATYVGGSSTDGGLAVAVDSKGGAILTGYTFSSDFDGRVNETRGFPAAYAARITSEGAVDWTTYLGGSGSQTGHGAAIDRFDRAYVVGSTESIDFEGRINLPFGGQDAFVVRVQPEGGVDWMRYLGGSSEDEGFGVAVDDIGVAWVAGATGSDDMEGRNNVFHGGGIVGTDAFVARLSPSGALDWSTYLGGSSDDDAADVETESTGAAIVIGTTGSADFEGADNASHGRDDVFAVRMLPNGLRDWMTHLGGSGWDSGNGVSIDSANTSVMTGWTLSNDFEGRINSYHPPTGGDAFAVRIAGRSSPSLVVDGSCPQGGPIRVTWSGASARGRVVLLYAAREGTSTVPSGKPCAGTLLNLDSADLQVVWQGTSDGSGSGSLNASAPGRACNGVLQLIDLTTCRTSDVAQVK